MSEIKSQTGLYAGDKIRIEGHWGNVYIRRVELFRDCLGVFLTQSDRNAGDFTPLCELYGFGAGSSNEYEPNHGQYVANPVALFSQVPSDTPEQE